MTKRVNGTSSSEETEEPNVQHPEQPESSRSKRGRKEKMVEVQGKDSLHQPKEGGRKGKSGKDAGNYDQQLEELEAELNRLKDTKEEWVKVEKELKSRRSASEQKTERVKSKIIASELKIERIKFGVTALEQEINELKSSVTVLEQETNGLRCEETDLEQKIDGLKSKITDLEQYIKMLRSFKENMSMDIDSPKDMASPVDHMDIDSEEETDARPLPPPKRPAKNKLITQGTGNSQTKVLESDKEQFLTELAKKAKEAYDSFVTALEKEKANLRAKRESIAVNAEEEDSANQAKDTADDDN